MRISIFDYGAGNLHSLMKALQIGGHDVRIETEIPAAIRSDALVLPGVGGFGAAAARIAPSTDTLRAALADGLPCLGICLGMQLLFDSSEEGAGAGIGAIPGRVRRLRAPRVPQIGWNGVHTAADPLFDETPQLVAYYAHSFVADAADTADEIGWTEYAGDRFAAAVRRGHIWGVQFHPEKSAAAGLRVIRNFLAQAAA
ncbi:MAG: imidazole glycerol phosphate synthase subunit HisH [Longimicrobiales bacterium]